MKVKELTTTNRAQSGLRKGRSIEVRKNQLLSLGSSAEFCSQEKWSETHSQLFYDPSPWREIPHHMKNGRGLNVGRKCGPFRRELATVYTRVCRWAHNERLMPYVYDFFKARKRCDSKNICNDKDISNTCFVILNEIAGMWKMPSLLDNTYHTTILEISKE